MNRQPLARWAPPSTRTFGDIAAKVGADLGLTPDPEQQWLLDAIYAERSPGVPAAFQVCVVAPRQNLKSATLEMAALTDLFVLGVPLSVWTAHEFKTARKSFEDMRTRILANPEFESRCKFRDSHGEEAITLHTGESIEFHARSHGSGRGFSCDRLTLDEALFLRSGDMGALLPTLITRPDAQVRFASSAGFAASEVLRGLRDRGRVGRDVSLAYVEYGAERRPCAAEQCAHTVGIEGCALDDRELWWQANCALWAGRITEGAVEHNRRGLPPAEFMREFLTWWEDPPSIGGAIDFTLWSSLADPDAERGADVVFGVDLDEARSASIAVAWKRPDGQPQVMLTTDGDRPDSNLSTAATHKRLVDLTSKWGGQVALGGPAAALEADLEDAGVRVLAVSSAEFAQACGSVADAVASRGLWHGNQEELNTSVRGARWRSVGTAGERAWQLKNATGIGPLAAATRALHALTTEGPSVLENRGPLTLG